MNIFLSTILITFVIYSSHAGQWQVHNQPEYLTIAPKNDKDQTEQYSIGDLVNNLQTLFGLSSDQDENNAKPLIYSKRPLEIPASTWLFHVEGLPQLSKDGISLEDNDGFNIGEIQSKLNRLGNTNDLNTVSILITSQSDIDNLEQTLENEVSQVDKQTPIKYVVITCEECNKQESIDKLQTLLKSSIDKIITKDPESFAMTLVTQENARVRRARDTEDATGYTNSTVTIAELYSDEYPVMFNLFFWTSLTLGIVLISIVYVFLTLDPGSDTIIYRMTQPRLKVD